MLRGVEGGIPVPKKMEARKTLWTTLPSPWIRLTSRWKNLRAQNPPHPRNDPWDTYLEEEADAETSS